MIEGFVQQLEFGNMPMPEIEGWRKFDLEKLLDGHYWIIHAVESEDGFDGLGIYLGYIEFFDSDDLPVTDDPYEIYDILDQTTVATRDDKYIVLYVKDFIEEQIPQAIKDDFFSKLREDDFEPPTVGNEVI